MANTDFYADRLRNIKPLGRGHFRITFEIRNVPRSFTTTNTLAIDTVRDYERGVFNYRPTCGYYSSFKSAFVALWAECKRAHNL